MPQPDNQTATPAQEPATIATTNTAKLATSATTKPSTKKAKPMTSDDVFSAIADAAADERSVVIRVTDLARHFGKPQSTISGWLKKWEKEGRIAMTRQPGKGAEIVFLRKGFRPLVEGRSDVANLTSPTPVSSNEPTPDPSSNPAPLDENLDGDFDASKPSSKPSSKLVPPVIEPATGSSSTSAASSSTSTTPPSSSVVLFRPAKVAPEPMKRTRRRHPAKPIPALALPSPEPAASTTTATPAEPSTSPAFRVSLPRQSPNTLLAWTVRGFAVAAIVLSVAMVGRHVASTEAASAFDWWTSFLVSVVISLLKPVFGSVAVVMSAKKSRRYAALAMVIALGALSYDATNLWAARGGSLENQAATDQAAIEARERNKARLENLIAEQRQLLAAKPGEVPAIVPSGPVRVAASTSTGEGPCQRIPAPWLRGKPEPSVVAEFGNCAAEVNALALKADLARAEAAQSQAERVAEAADRRAARLAELPALIAETERTLEARPVIAGAHNGAEAAANVLNWIPSMVGVTIASAHGVRMGWVLAFVLLIEIVAVFGFGFATLVQREEESAA